MISSSILINTHIFISGIRKHAERTQVQHPQIQNDRGDANLNSGCGRSVIEANKSDVESCESFSLFMQL
jgi:hypothetical protein